MKSGYKRLGDYIRLVDERNRKAEVLFMDLREMGVPFEKKFTEFSKDNIKEITSTFHNWQTDKAYENIPEYCYAAKIEEIKSKDYSLVPSKYIEFVNRDENVDYREKMTALQEDLMSLLKAEKQSNEDLKNVFEKLGYEVGI